MACAKYWPAGTASNLISNGDCLQVYGGDLYYNTATKKYGWRSMPQIGESTSQGAIFDAVKAALLAQHGGKFICRTLKLDPDPTAAAFPTCYTPDYYVWDESNYRFNPMPANVRAILAQAIDVPTSQVSDVYKISELSSYGASASQMATPSSTAFQTGVPNFVESVQAVVQAISSQAATSVSASASGAAQSIESVIEGAKGGIQAVVGEGPAGISWLWWGVGAAAAYFLFLRGRR